MMGLCSGVIDRETGGMKPMFAFPAKSLLLYIGVPKHSALLKTTMSKFPL
jgi:hypothetical protein